MSAYNAGIKLRDKEQFPECLRAKDVAPGRNHAERIIIRCWPKAISGYPIAVLALLFTTIATLCPRPEYQGLHEVLGMIFCLCAAVIPLVVVFDCPGWSSVMIALGAAVAFLLILLVSLNTPFNVLSVIVSFVAGVHFLASRDTYLFVTVLFLAIFGIAWITNRFDYWQLTPNELLYNKGPFSDMERYAAANLQVEKAIPDPFELFLCRGGRLVFFPRSEQSVISLGIVVGVNQFEQRIKHLLNALEVRVDADQTLLA